MFNQQQSTTAAATPSVAAPVATSPSILSQPFVTHPFDAVTSAATFPTHLCRVRFRCGRSCCGRFRHAAAHARSLPGTRGPALQHGSSLHSLLLDAHRSNWPICHLLWPLRWLSSRLMLFRLMLSRPSTSRSDLQPSCCDHPATATLMRLHGSSSPLNGPK